MATRCPVGKESEIPDLSMYRSRLRPSRLDTIKVASSLPFFFIQNLSKCDTVTSAGSELPAKPNTQRALCHVYVMSSCLGSKFACRYHATANNLMITSLEYQMSIQNEPRAIISRPLRLLPYFRPCAGPLRPQRQTLYSHRSRLLPR